MQGRQQGRSQIKAEAFWTGFPRNLSGKPTGRTVINHQKKCERAQLAAKPPLHLQRSG